MSAIIHFKLTADPLVSFAVFVHSFGGRSWRSTRDLLATARHFRFLRHDFERPRGLLPMN